MAVSVDLIIELIGYISSAATVCVLLLNLSHVRPVYSHVCNAEFCNMLLETGVLFWSALGCMLAPCSRHDGSLRPRGATPEPPRRNDPCSVTRLTRVAIGTNKGSHLIKTSTLRCQGNGNIVVFARTGTLQSIRKNTGVNTQSLIK